MIKRINLNMTFGIAGLIAGIVFISIGLWICLLYSINGIIPLLIGAFLAFSTESTYIHTQNHQVRNTMVWFGLIPVEQWIAIKQGMNLKIQKPDYAFMPYNRKKRIALKGDDFYYLLLFDEKDEFILPVKKYKRKEDAEEELNKIKQWMRLSS